MTNKPTKLRDLLHKFYNIFNGNKLSPTDAIDQAESAILEIMVPKEEMDRLKDLLREASDALEPYVKFYEKYVDKVVGDSNGLAAKEILTKLREVK